MSNRRSMKQTGSLGDAIDARLRQQREGGEVQRDTLGAGAGAPLSSGGTPAGGGGVTDDPALPESFVTGLAGGAGNPLQAGDLRLTGSGALEITQDTEAGEIGLHSPAYSAGDGLELAAEEFSVDSSVVRTTGNQSISGIKQFASLPRSPATPALDEELATKEYVDERTRVVHRQVFPAAGSRDSVGGNNEINLPWDVSAYPSGATVATLSLNVITDFSFDNSIGACSINRIAMQFTWTSSESSNIVVNGLQLALSTCIPILGSAANLQARVRVENKERLDSLILSMNEEGGSNLNQSSNLLDQTTNNVWTTINADDLDTSLIESVAFLTLTIQGTSDYTNVGTTNVQVAWLAVDLLE